MRADVRRAASIAAAASVLLAGAASNPDPSRTTWPAVARFGVIATVVPGFDVDAGWQVRLNDAAPAQTILVGATLRW